MEDKNKENSINTSHQINAAPFNYNIGPGQMEEMLKALNSGDNKYKELPNIDTSYINVDSINKENQPFNKIGREGLNETERAWLEKRDAVYNSTFNAYVGKTILTDTLPFDPDWAISKDTAIKEGYTAGVEAATTYKNDTKIGDINPDELVEMMAEGKIDTLGKPMTSKEESSDIRTKGFIKVGALSVITGAVSIGIVILGTFLMK